MPKFETEQIEHLKMVQAIVSRMAGAAAEVKKITMAVVGIGLAAAFGAGKSIVLLFIAFLTIVFAGLDTMYLRQEIWFRNLYDRFLGDSANASLLFRLTPDSDLRNSASFWKAAMSWSVWGFYGPIVLVLLFSGWMLGCSSCLSVLPRYLRRLP